MRLQVPGIERLEGTSVHYSATVYEAQQCRTDPVAVVGGGNSAGQAVLFLAGYAPKVHLLVRGPSLEANMSRYLVDQVERHPRVEVMLHTEVTEVIGQEVLEELDVVDNRTGGHSRLAVRGLFVFTGADPHTEWLMRHHCPRLPRLRPHRPGGPGSLRLPRGVARPRALVHDPGDQPARGLRGRRRP